MYKGLPEIWQEIIMFHFENSIHLPIAMVIELQLTRTGTCFDIQLAFFYFFAYAFVVWSFITRQNLGFLRDQRFNPINFQTP